MSGPLKGRAGGPSATSAGSQASPVSSMRGVSPWPLHTILALVAVCTGGLVLRVVGLQFGLPDVYNPDEVAIMSRALSFAKGTLNPENFLYPTFYFYVLFTWVGAYLAFLLLIGRVESLAALRSMYFTAPSGIYTAGRTLGVLSGVATIGLLHRLAARLMDGRTAMAAAVFLAVAPLHVRDSHYVKHDVPATLTIVLAYLAISRVWPLARPGGPRTRDTCLAAGVCGVAFSTHYYSIFLALPFALAVIRAWRTGGWRTMSRQLLAGGAVSIVVFLALSPFIALEPATAWRDIIANRAIVVDRAVATGFFASAARYLDMLWKDSAGMPVVALAAAGAVWMLVRQPGLATLLLAFPIPFLIFISNTAPASRYLNPVLPFIALFAAWALSQALTRLRARPIVLWVAVALAAAPALMSSIRVGLFFRQDDTRTLARRFIENQIPPDTGVAIQPHSVVLTPTRASLVAALARHEGGAAAASTKFQIQMALDPYPSTAYRLVYLGRGGLDREKIYVDYAELGGSAGLTALRRQGVTFVVVKRYNRPDSVTLPFLTALTREARLVAVFSPYRPGTVRAEQARVEPFLHNTDTRIDTALARPGPLLEIWELDGRSSESEATHTRGESLTVVH